MLVLEVVTYPIVSLVISTYIWEGSYLTPTHQHAHNSGIVQTRFNWIKTQNQKLHKRTLVGFIYTFWYFLSSTSSILKQGFQSIHHLQMTSSEGFQQHFSVLSKSVCYGFYMIKNVAFTLISFAVLKRDDCLSVQLPFQLPVQILVQLLLELESN